MRHAAILGLLLSAALLGCGRQAREANQTTVEKSGAKTKSAEPDSTTVGLAMPGVFSADLDIPVQQGSFPLAVAKTGIERPLERAIAGAQPRPKKGEQALTPKMAIELPVKSAGAVGLAMPGVLSADLDIPVSKGRIERPLEGAIAGAQTKPIPTAAERAADHGKYDIELPVKNTIAGNQMADQPAASSDKFRNPKVEPGKVRWHEDFQTACAASKKSGKPVLLFQMIGKLDDRFC